MEDAQQLEAEKQQKKGEMDALLNKMQEAIHSSKQSEQTVNTEEQEAKMQAVGKMQAELTEKKSLIETTLKELQEGMTRVNELETKAKEGEDVKSEITTLTVKIKEKRDLLEKAIKEMEELKKNCTAKFKV